MDLMRRGDIILAVFSGDYGKPRPAVVVQTDLTLDTHQSLTVCPVTSTLIDAPLFRLDLIPSAETGLTLPSQIMVDKVGSIRRDKARDVIGRIDQDTLLRLGRALAFWVGLG